jgi:uncharacterized protein YndB with AHSA1/START domain
MPHNGSSSAAAETSRQIRATRVFDAPRELVFSMWTDAEHLGQWWGPRGFSITTHSIDVRPGGEWRFVMHGPDGTDYRNHIVYVAIDAPSRITYRHVSGPIFDAEATFEVRGAQTAVTVCMTFESAELRNRVAEEFGAVEGLHQTLERLGERVAEHDDTFILTRTFDAPRELVFRAWTETGHLMHWWGVKGFELLKCDVDLRPGGVMHYGMRMPDGNMMWARWVYREIVPPERLTFVSTFSDESGGVTRAPFFDGKWPLETLTTLTFTEHDGKTTLTMLGRPVNATELERDTFRGNHQSMQGGWGATLDQLVAYLRTRP